MFALRSLAKSVAILTLSLSAAALSGCHASGSVGEANHHGGDASVSATTTAPSPGVACDKCKIVWVKSPNYMSNKGGPIYGYRTTEKMECPECRDAVTNFFMTGKLEHHCKACDGTMQTCEAH